MLRASHVNRLVSYLERYWLRSECDCSGWWSTAGSNTPHTRLVIRKYSIRILLSKSDKAGNRLRLLTQYMKSGRQERGGDRRVASQRTVNSLFHSFSSDRVTRPLRSTTHYVGDFQQSLSLERSFNEILQVRSEFATAYPRAMPVLPSSITAPSCRSSSS
jgi:hypothetical protein